MNNKVNVLCDTCIYHGTLGNIDVCAYTGPNWDVIDNKFICNNYVEIKEEKDNEEKKL